LDQLLTSLDHLVKLTRLEKVDVHPRAALRIAVSHVTSGKLQVRL